MSDPVARDRLAAELAVMTRLHGLATRFVYDGDLAALLDAAVEEAIAIVGTDSGQILLAREPGGRWEVAAARGSTTAPAGDERVQETPLRSRAGTLVGVLSTRHRQAAPPDERDLVLLDLLARQCADAVERARSMEARAQSSARAEWAERVRESEELFRTTVENMPVNLVLCDRDGRLLYLNPALVTLVSTMCKRTPQELIGLPGAEVWSPNIWNPLRTHIERAMATGERQTYELETKLPNGQRMVRQWAVVPLAGPDGDVRRILAMSHDITAQRRLLDEVREADRRKSEFIAVLSHELRNPLAAIRTSLYLLEHERSGKAVTEQARRVIDRQVTHLVRMVDDLLDVTRIAQDKVRLQRQRLDINEIVRETVEDNRAHLERGGVRLDAKLAGRPLYVSADGARMAQVLTNLLSNAAKFTPSGGTATVSVSADADDHAVVSVADTGSGIEPALLPRVFEPFIQSDRTLDRAGGGLGLGLALVKGLIDLHGGEVRASSEGKGQGARFVVRLPLDAGAAAQEAAPVGGAAAGVSRRVLVIEDDPDIADGLQVTLRLFGHQVEIARDGREGLQKARAFRPEVVLCDIGLPEMDGYEVARAFRADDALRSAYLVALTGYAQAEDLEKARRSGFDRHLAKPASVELIQQIVADGLARLAREASR